ncbi:hypothetical protein RF11_11648 [Thelohanellus kitauei]|uniref:Uncharacterized protein n=1 Tax=Thelohanellus kitauei TaxID=669202 RepID=A0A0C2ICV7_THEKT|nr:hypothetical protein RF11_11648 [Thelohanellus kitauei]
MIDIVLIFYAFIQLLSVNNSQVDEIATNIAHVNSTQIDSNLSADHDIISLSSGNPEMRISFQKLDNLQDQKDSISDLSEAKKNSTFVVTSEEIDEDKVLHLDKPSQSSSGSQTDSTGLDDLIN